MVNKKLIQNRIKNFWGYGSLNSPVWFVGMEEGTGPEISIKEIEEIFLTTKNKTTIDMRNNYCSEKMQPKWFKKNPPLQPTWKYLIALYLYLKNGSIPSKSDIQKHQELILGDSKIMENTVIELMPLPSRKANESSWMYAGYGIDELNSRKEYLDKYKPIRVEALKDLIKKHNPKLVVFYSLGYLSDWTEIIGQAPEEITKQMYYIKKDKTSFCVIPQSVSFGMSYKRMYEFGKKIKIFDDNII